MVYSKQQQQQEKQRTKLTKRKKKDVQIIMKCNSYDLMDNISVDNMETNFVQFV